MQLKRRYDLIPNIVETDLKANSTMLSLMEELTSTENKVAFSRQAYDDSVIAYNTQREVFPDHRQRNLTMKAYEHDSKYDDCNG